jgi:hypothetical protein
MTTLQKKSTDVPQRSFTLVNNLCTDKQKSTRVFKVLSFLMRFVISGSLKAVLATIVCILTTSSAHSWQELRPTYEEYSGIHLKCRWFYSFGYRRNRPNVEKIKTLIDIGADHALNGMVLSSFGLDSVTRWKEKDIALLKEIAAHCKNKRIELIPTGFSVGYGGGALEYDRSFAAALPATISLKVKERNILPAPAENLLVNGDLEDYTNNRFKGYEFHDKPGQISFVDTIAVSGKASIRFENFGFYKNGHGRIMQKVRVRPGRTYRFSFKLKTQGLGPTSAFKAMVYAGGRSLASWIPKFEPTEGWKEVKLDYINKDEKEVSVYAGIWQGKSGKFWLDDLRFFEYGDLSDIPRRKGTPLELKSIDRDKIFVEGKDFKDIRCLRELKYVSLLPGSSIREGENLELSCYKIPSVAHSWGKQISLCMSNSKLYEYWKAQAGRLHEIIPFKKVLLSMDEIRNGGGCLSCKKRGISMAEILGDCITRQYAIFKAIDPKIEVMIWSDMLDPAHNAHDNYYGIEGDFTGSWKHVPRDLTIMCWYHKIREESLGFFSKQGFRTFGAAYYDADDLTNSREWLASLMRTPYAHGIMYTTWEKNYRLLADFGNLVLKIATERKDGLDKK